jgi:hypothetical protein
VNREAVDLTRDVLDHEIVDVDDLPCGMVDDVEFAGGAGKPLQVVAILVGAHALFERLPFGLGRVIDRLVKQQSVRVPWSAVARVADRVHLNVTAASLSLDRGERRPATLVSRLPRS